MEQFIVTSYRHTKWQLVVGNSRLSREHRPQDHLFEWGGENEIALAWQSMQGLSYLDVASGDYIKTLLHSTDAGHCES